MRLRFDILWPIRVAIVVTALFSAIWSGTAVAPQGLVSFGTAIHDSMVRLRATAEAESRVIVVDIDESSLEISGPWPWPHDRLADLAEILLGPLGARAVALDMVLPEVDGSTGDARLAALAQHASLTLAVALDYQDRHPPLAIGSPGTGEALNRVESAVNATGFVGNNSLLANARCVGNIGFLPDADGAIRKLPGLSQLQGRTFRSLAEALVICSGNDSARVSREVDGHGFWRIPYRRSWSSFTVVPAAQVLNENVPEALFRERLVLIGSSALGLSDRVTTPLSVSTSGVMVHAASVSAMLDKEGWQTAYNGMAITVVWLVLSLIAWLALLSRVSPYRGMLFLVGSSMAWLGLVFWLIDFQLDILPPLSASAVLLVLGVPFEWWWSRRESERVIEMFAHYVAPSVLDELLRQRGAQPLLPHFCEVTVLVADMEGYTQSTASLGLTEAAKLTRDFLDCLTRPVLDEDGTLDKYTGDGLVAFWNAPLPTPNHPERAVRAALRIVDRVRQLNDQRMAQGFAAVRVRIGIETGPALVGDLGTCFRSTYTAVGNCINLASKLESAARNLSTDIIIGPTTFARLPDPESYAPLERLFLSGIPLDCWTPKYSGQPDNNGLQ